MTNVPPPSHVTLHKKSATTALVRFKAEGGSVIIVEMDAESSFASQHLVRRYAGPHEREVAQDALVEGEVESRLYARVLTGDAEGHFSTPVASVPAYVSLGPEEGGQGGEGDSSRWSNTQVGVACGVLLLMMCCMVAVYRRVCRRCRQKQQEGQGQGQQQKQQQQQQQQSYKVQVELGTVDLGQNIGNLQFPSLSSNVGGGRQGAPTAASAAAASAEDEGEEEVLLQFSALREPEHDAAWFQSTWQAADNSRKVEHALRSGGGGGMDSCLAIECMLEKNNFQVVASGEASPGLFKIYFFAQDARGSDAIVLVEMVCDCGGGVVSAVFKGESGRVDKSYMKAVIKMWKVTFREHLEADD